MDGRSPRRSELHSVLLYTRVKPKSSQGQACGHRTLTRDVIWQVANGQHTHPTLGSEQCWAQHTPAAAVIAFDTSCRHSHRHLGVSLATDKQNSFFPSLEGGLS